MRKRKTLKIKEALHVYRSAKELRGTNLEGTEKAEVCGGALRLTSAQSTSPHPYCLQLTNPPFAFYLEHLPHPRYQISQQFYPTPSPIPAFCWNYPLVSPQCYCCIYINKASSNVFFRISLRTTFTLLLDLQYV